MAEQPCGPRYITGKSARGHERFGRRRHPAWYLIRPGTMASPEISLTAAPPAPVGGFARHHVLIACAFVAGHIVLAALMRLEATFATLHGLLTLALGLYVA